MGNKEEIQKIVDEYQMNNIVNPDVDPETATLADTVRDIDINSLPSALQFDGKTDIEDKDTKSLEESINKKNITRFFEDSGIRTSIKKYIKYVYDSLGGDLEYTNYDDDGYFSYEDFNEKGFNLKDNPISRDIFLNNVRNSFYKGKFDAAFNDTVGMTSANPRKENKTEDTRPEFDVNQSSDDREIAIYNNINSKKQDTLDVENAVRLKYAAIEGIARNVASGRSALSFGLIAGDPGIGKTYCVERAIKEGLEEWTPNAKNKTKPTLVKVSGSIGSSFTDIVTFFYQNRHDKLILLDDADGFLLSDSQDVQNLMKGLFSEELKEISIPPIILARINSNLAKQFEAEKAEREELENEGFTEEFSESSSNPNIKMDRFGNILSMREGSFGKDDAFNTVERYKKQLDRQEFEKEKAKDRPPRIRNNFIFDSSIVFISNLELKQLDSAVLSRTDKYAITLTEQEFICRAEQILSTMEVGRYSSTSKEVLEWAKKESFAYLKLLLINREKYSNFNVEVNCKLTFRIIPELTNIYLRHALGYCRKEKVDMDDPKNRPKIQKNVQDDFIFDLLSILRTNTKK